MWPKYKKRKTEEGIYRKEKNNEKTKRQNRE